MPEGLRTLTVPVMKGLGWCHVLAIVTTKRFPEEWSSTRCSIDCFQPLGIMDKYHVTYSGLATMRSDTANLFRPQRSAGIKPYKMAIPFFLGLLFLADLISTWNLGLMT